METASSASEMTSDTGFQIAQLYIVCDLFAIFQDIPFKSLTGSELLVTVKHSTAN